MSEYTDSSPVRKSQQQINQITGTIVMPAIREAILAGARQVAGDRYTDPDVFDVDEAAEQIIRRVIGFLFLCNVIDEDAVLHPRQLDNEHIKAWFGVR